MPKLHSRDHHASVLYNRLGPDSAISPSPRKYYKHITDDEGASIHRCGRQPSPEEAVHVRGLLLNNQISCRGSGGMMLAWRLLSGASARGRCTTLYRRIADADDDGAAIHRRWCNPSSSEDEIVGRGRQGWFLEASRGGGGR